MKNIYSIYLISRRSVYNKIKGTESKGQKEEAKMNNIGQFDIKEIKTT